MRSRTHCRTLAPIRANMSMILQVPLSHFEEMQLPRLNETSVKVFVMRAENFSSYIYGDFARPCGAKVDVVLSGFIEDYAGITVGICI